MSSSNVNIIGAAGFRCDGIKGSSEKQQGHFTPLQLNDVNQSTVQIVQTSDLYGSSSDCNRISKQIGHCRWSIMAGLLQLASGTSRLGVRCGGTIPLIQAIINAVNYCWATSKSWMCLCNLDTSLWNDSILNYHKRFDKTTVFWVYLNLQTERIDIWLARKVSFIIGSGLYFQKYLRYRSN